MQRRVFVLLIISSALTETVLNNGHRGIINGSQTYCHDTDRYLRILTLMLIEAEGEEVVGRDVAVEILWGQM